MKTLWQSFSRKLINRIEQPFSSGIFNEEIAEKHRMRLAIGRGYYQNSHVVLYWLVDPVDGIIADAKFQVYGPPLLIGAAEASCDLAVGKNRLQAARITPEQIEKYLRDHPQKASFSNEMLKDLQPIITAIHQASAACQEIPLDQEIVSPVPHASSEENTVFPNWHLISKEEKLAIIEEVLTKEVRPYVEMDEGGVEVLNLIDEELVIAYKGACTSCFSSVGATLAGIQEILRAKIHPSLTVTPHLDGLQLD